MVTVVTVVLPSLAETRKVLWREALFFFSVLSGKTFSDVG
jgi:hypothetical protein